MDGTPTLSPALQAAQELLYRKRAEARAERIRRGLPVDIAQSLDETPPPERERSLVERVAELPEHLGWESAAATQAIRKALARTKARRTPEEQTPEPVPAPAEAECHSHSNSQQALQSAGVEANSQTKSLSDKPAIKIFGHVCDAIGRHKLDGVGRVWLLLRYLDREQGQGRVAVQAARGELTRKGGTLQCLSWKRLRQLLNEGEGQFWHRDKQGDYIYYHSEVRVAASLGLGRIRGWAVKIPVEDLLGSITAVRALFYDAFHSARGDGFNHPITRRVMEDRGNGDGRTQRKYEQLRGMPTLANFALLGRYSKPAWQRARHEEAAERVGGPAFIYVDYKGILGENPHRLKRPAGQRHWHNIYIMRQIGNAYQGTLPTAKRGRRWTNHKLQHLCNSMHPTGSLGAGEADRRGERFYHETEEQATQALARDKGKPTYWVYPDRSGASGYWQEPAVPWEVDY